MKIPVQISTRKLTLTEKTMNVIRSKVEKLEQFYNKMISCRVMVETPHRHKNHGTLYNVSIDISVPGAELVVKREPHEDIYVAIREAFEAARRQLLHHNSKRKKNKLGKMIADQEMKQDSMEHDEIDEDYANESVGWQYDDDEFASVRY